MNQPLENRSNAKGRRKVDFDIDTPYFRRSTMMRDNPELSVMALRIDQFLGEIGVIQVSIEDTPVEWSAKKGDVTGSPLSKSAMTSKTRLSSMSISLGENNLYLRRKTSANPGPAELASQDT